MIFRPLLASIPIFQTIYFCDYLALSKGSKTRDLGLKHTMRDTSSQTIAPNGILNMKKIITYNRK